MSDPESGGLGDRLDPDRAAGGGDRLDADRAAGGGDRLDADRAADGGRHRLDPDLAAAPGEPERPDRIPAPIISTRPYRIAIGLFALALVIAFSAYQLTRRSRTPTMAVGHQLHYFAAPLAVSNLNGDANLNPPCTLARHDPRALNVCLLVQRAPLVLAFFVTRSSKCESEVNTLQAVAGQLPPGRVSFAAVAVGDSHSDTRAAVRKHRWTIPVAYDADGGVGAVFEVEVCPMLVLARRGGLVADVLIGNRWLSPAALAPRVRTLLAG